MSECACGCGNDAGIYTKTDSRRDERKGEQRYLALGHKLTGQSTADEITAANIGDNATIPVTDEWLERQGIEIPDGEDKRWVYATVEQQSEGIGGTKRHWLRVVPTTYSGPDWPVVQPAAPVKIHCTKIAARRTPGLETAFIFPDTQIGYRQIRDDNGALYLDPFHDEIAIAVAMAVCRSLQPDVIVFLGDTLDLPGQSKYIQDPAWALTAQDAVNRAHAILAEVRASCPRSRIVILEGNHDLRLPNSIQVNAAASFRLQRANMPSSWPVLTVPHLLRLDELEIEYLDGYPANRLWINDRLCCIHGNKVRSSGSTAAAVIEDERVSVIFGHVHRIEMQHKTRHVRSGPRQSFAATPGCLCRIDGAVPSVKGGVDALGRPLVSYEDWQHGFGVVTYEPGDGPFALELVAIHGGAAIFRGRVFDAGA